MENKSFLENLSKGFKLKSVYTTEDRNNTEKVYNDLILNYKKTDDVLYKKGKKEFDKNKNILQEAKKLFDLWVEIYKNVILVEENLKFEESVGERVKLKNERVNLPATTEQKEFNKFLQQIKEEQKNIDINLFKNIFN